MCTVTVVPRRDGYRVACNRDERHDRPPASAPRSRRVAGRMAVFPVDPASGGTWLGVNDAGLVVALLNRHDGRPRDDLRRRAPSRGLIVPAVLGCRRAMDAIDAACRLDLPSFAPFRLLATDGAEVALLTLDSGRPARMQLALTRPLMFTSSALGDDVVEGPRRQLFERLVLGTGGSWLAGQRRFHRHRWPACPALSVEMQRLDARTVSRSVIDVMAGRTVFRYEPLMGAKAASS
jgi:transport and Golgi organization protein 2